MCCKLWIAFTNEMVTIVAWLYNELIYNIELLGYE